MRGAAPAIFPYTVTAWCVIKEEIKFSLSCIHIEFLGCRNKWLEYAGKMEGTSQKYRKLKVKLYHREGSSVKLSRYMPYNLQFVLACSLQAILIQIWCRDNVVSVTVSNVSVKAQREKNLPYGFLSHGKWPGLEQRSVLL